jgi:ATP-dependent Zn protease
MRGPFGWFLLAALCIALFFLLSNSHSDQTRIPFSTFREQLLAANVTQVEIDGDTLRGHFQKPVTLNTLAVTQFKTDLPPGVAAQWSFVDWLTANAHGATVNAENSQSLLLSIVVPLIPWLLIFGFIWFFVFRQLRKNNQSRLTPAPVYLVQPPDGTVPPPTLPGA